MESGPLEDRRGWSPGLGCACREDRCMEAGCREAASLGNGGLLQAARVHSWSPPNKCVHRFPWRACSQEGLAPFSIFNLEATSQCASRLQTSHPNQVVEADPQRSTGWALSVASRGGRLPSSAQTPPAPESSDGERYTLISSAVLSRRGRAPGGGLGDKFN